jgi:hypothetical protein
LTVQEQPPSRTASRNKQHHSTSSPAIILSVELTSSLPGFQVEQKADARQFADAKYLMFAEIDPRISNVRTLGGPVRGRTFELQIPWSALGILPDGETSFVIEIQAADHTALRLPVGAGQGTLVFAE